MILPRDGAVEIGIAAFTGLELGGVDAPPSVCAANDAHLGVEHFVKDDVAHEEFRHAIVVQAGVDANQVLVRAVAAQSNTALRAIASSVAAPGD